MSSSKKTPRKRRQFTVALIGVVLSLLGCRDASSAPAAPRAPVNSAAARFISATTSRENADQQAARAPLLLGQLRAHGVLEGAQLALEFFFYTDTQVKAGALATDLLALGYAVEHGPSASDRATRVVTGWTTRMSMTDATVIAWTRNMSELGFEHDCEFDGWGTNPNQD